MPLTFSTATVQAINEQINTHFNLFYAWVPIAFTLLPSPSITLLLCRTAGSDHVPATIAGITSGCGLGEVLRSCRYNAMSAFFARDNVALLGFGKMFRRFADQNYGHALVFQVRTSSQLAKQTMHIPMMLWWGIRLFGVCVS